MSGTASLSARLTVAIGGLCGAGGVALSAVAAHLGGGNVGTAAAMLLAHAPLLVVLGLWAQGKLFSASAWTLAAGLILFCGDLLARHYLGARLFAMAAPAGGVLLIAGWLLVAVAGLVRRG